MTTTESERPDVAHDKRKRARLLGMAVGVALGVAIIVYIVMQFAGANSTAPILTFFGVLVTVVAKSVFDRRSDQRLRQEASVADQRLRQEAALADQRLRLDAAMRAGALLAPSRDVSASPAAAASGLLALTELDRSDLAVALLVDLWKGKWDLSSPRVSTETAILVINAALQSGATQPGAPLVAAELLCRHAADLDACQSLHWPASLDGRWLRDVGPKTKLLLVEALVDMSRTSDPTLNALRSFAVRIYGIFDGDDNPHVKGCVAGLIDAILPALRESPYKNFMQGSKNVALSELERAAQHAVRNSDEFLAHMMDCRRRQLADWTSKCVKAEVTPEIDPGALADAWCDFVTPHRAGAVAQGAHSA